MTSQVSINQANENELELKLNDENKPAIEKQTNKISENKLEEKHTGIDKPLENAEFHDEKKIQIEEKLENQEVIKNSIDTIEQQDKSNNNSEENLEEVKILAEKNSIKTENVEKIESEPIEFAKSFQNDVPIIKDLKENSSSLNEIIQSNLSLEEELCNIFFQLDLI